MRSLHVILLTAFCVSIVATILIPGAACAQTAGPPMADSVGAVFRSVIDSVAATAGLASLRDQELPRGVRREVRLYVGFGLAHPQQAVRVWEDAGGVHGWLGLWWPGTRLTYRISGGTEADYVQARQEHATWVAEVRDLAAESGCTEFRARPDYETCTLPGRGIQWADVLAHLDGLGVARLPHPRDRLGLDGVTLVVEHRDTAGYRSYSYWSPRTDARDAHERAAAAIMESIMRLRSPEDPR